MGIEIPWGMKKFQLLTGLVTFAAAILVGGGSASAAEADYFTERADFARREVSRRLDLQMNFALGRAMETVTRKTGRCDKRDAIRGVLNVLGRNSESLVRPKIGEWRFLIAGLSQTPHNVDIANSIYRDLANMHLAKFDAKTFPAKTTYSPVNLVVKAVADQQTRLGRPAAINCCDPVFAYKNVYVSTDKLEHFLQVGFDGYYFAENIDLNLGRKHDLILGATYASIAPLRGHGEEAMLAFNRATEEGVFGLEYTGVYSYADAVANFEGYRFWKNLTETYEGKAPYFLCEDGAWKRNEARPFSFQEYIHPGWDEGINCNAYRLEWKAVVDNRIRETGNHCPAQPKHCDYLRKRYRGGRASLISPECVSPSADANRDIPTS